MLKDRKTLSAALLSAAHYLQGLSADNIDQQRIQGAAELPSKRVPESQVADQPQFDALPKALKDALQVLQVQLSRSLILDSTKSRLDNIFDVTR